MFLSCEFGQLLAIYTEVLPRSAYLLGRCGGIVLLGFFFGGVRRLPTIVCCPIRAILLIERDEYGEELVAVARLLVLHLLQRLKELLHLAEDVAVLLVDGLHLLGEGVVVGTLAAVRCWLAVFASLLLVAGSRAALFDGALDSWHLALLHLGHLPKRKALEPYAEVLGQFLFQPLPVSVADDMGVEESVAVEPKEH